MSFDHTDGGLIFHGATEHAFQVAGSDKKWHWATATLQGDKLVARATEVPKPVALRYAWQGMPQASLYNKAGFPAVPFRTDKW